VRRKSTGASKNLSRDQDEEEQAKLTIEEVKCEVKVERECTEERTSMLGVTFEKEQSRPGKYNMADKSQFPRQSTESSVIEVTGTARGTNDIEQVDIVTESNDSLRTRILPSPANENHLGPSSNAPTVNASDPREQPIDQQGLLRLICEEEACLLIRLKDQNANLKSEMEKRRELLDQLAASEKRLQQEQEEIQAISEQLEQNSKLKQQLIFQADP